MLNLYHFSIYFFFKELYFYNIFNLEFRLKQLNEAILTSSRAFKIFHNLPTNYKLKNYPFNVFFKWSFYLFIFDHEYNCQVAF